MALLESQVREPKEFPGKFLRLLLRNNSVMRQPRVEITDGHSGPTITSQKHHEEADPLLQRALAIDEKVYGPGHPEVATDLHNRSQRNDPGKGVFVSSFNNFVVRC